MSEEDLNAAFLELVEGGGFDRILRTLRNQWDRVPRETILNAVRDAATDVVRRHRDGQAIDNVAALVTTIARRKLIKIWDSIQEGRAAGSALELQVKHPEAWQHDEERIVRVKRAADYVRTLVPQVDNERYRRTLYEMLDAAEQGRQLMPKELAEILDCSPNTASKQMERAPARLLPILKEAGFNTVGALLQIPPQATDNYSDDNKEIKND
ncbi:hypothetical protein [Mycobacterium colombiense]|uniref:hypothetical protein n=1 Tax=Mycobacterium colombiense TaxID=339268 RepID=UPI00096EB298|nr:hypothetical protein [Mycobacterium colombiense]OMB94509.1 hypothetical protein A5732_13660 [Mycobacterium colombiense]